MKAPTIELIVHPEDASVRGNALASGDDAVDKAVEDEILARLAADDIWAWCCVEVRASDGELFASEYLGCCSYEDEANFKAGIYYPEMVKAAVKQLEAKINESKTRG